MASTAECDYECTNARAHTYYQSASTDTQPYNIYHSDEDGMEVTSHYKAWTDGQRLPSAC
jgi:hypothetical protein